MRDGPRVFAGLCARGGGAVRFCLTMGVRMRLFAESLPCPVAMAVVLAVAATALSATGASATGRGRVRHEMLVSTAWLAGHLEDRGLVVLHYFQDLSLREVGAVLGVPPGTAKSRINRALQALRSLLEKEAAHDRSKPETAVAGDA